MSRNNYTYGSFVSGEVSPKFLGRTDTQQYNQACEEIRNMIVHPQGGVSRRPGTISRKQIFKSDGVTSPRQVRLLPFYGTDGTRWQLVLTDELATVTNGNTSPAPIVDPDDCAWKAINVDTGEVSALAFFDSLAVTTYFTTYYNFSSTGLDINMNELQYAQAGDTMIIVHGDMRPMRLTYDPSLEFSGTKFYFEAFPHTFDASVGVAVPTHYYKEYAFNLPGFMFADEADFTSITVDLNVVGDSPDGGNNNAKLTFSNAHLTSNEWVGRVMKFNHASKTIVLQIYQVLTTTTANAVVLAGIMNADPTTFTFDEIEYSAWDDIHGWPKTVAFFEGRLIFGGTDYFPDKEWFSEDDNIENFETRRLEQDPDFADPVVATDPFAVTLKQNIYSSIRWIAPDKTIVTGTNSAEFIVKGPDSSQSVGATNVASGAETPHGSAYVQPVKFENTTIFLQRDRKSLREMVFDLGENSFIAPNLNILGEHIANKFALERADEEYHLAVLPGSFVAVVRHEVPWATIWALDNNGCLSGLTRDRQQNVAAWHTHELAGDFDEGGTLYKPFIQSISTIQRQPLDETSSGGEPDSLWMAVKRRRDATNAFFVESLADEWTRGPTHLNWDLPLGAAPVFLDSAVFVDSQTSGAPVYDIANGLTDALEPFRSGDVVTVIMNGYDLGEFTVNAQRKVDISAKLTADQYSGVERVQCIIGYNYIAKIVPVIPEVPAQIGSSLGQVRRVDTVTTQFYRSMGVRVGRVSDEYQEHTPIDDAEEISFPQPVNSDLSDPPKMFTGDKTIIFPQGYDRRPKIMIESFRPFPCQISFITARLTVNE